MIQIILSDLTHILAALSILSIIGGLSLGLAHIVLRHIEMRNRKVYMPYLEVIEEEAAKIVQKRVTDMMIMEQDLIKLERSGVTKESVLPEGWIDEGDYYFYPKTIIAKFYKTPEGDIAPLPAREVGKYFVSGIRVPKKPTITEIYAEEARHRSCFSKIRLPRLGKVYYVCCPGTLKGVNTLKALERIKGMFLVA